MIATARPKAYTIKCCLMASARLVAWRPSSSSRAWLRIDLSSASIDWPWRAARTRVTRVRLWNSTATARLHRGATALTGAMRAIDVGPTARNGKRPPSGAWRAFDRLKTATPGIHHKSEVEGVRLGLATAGEVALAYEALARRLGPRVIVAAMAKPGRRRCSIISPRPAATTTTSAT